MKTFLHTRHVALMTLFFGAMATAMFLPAHAAEIWKQTAFAAVVGIAAFTSIAYWIYQRGGIIRREFRVTNLPGRSPKNYAGVIDFTLASTLPWALGYVGLYFLWPDFFRALSVQGLFIWLLPPLFTAVVLLAFTKPSQLKLGFVILLALAGVLGLWDQDRGDFRFSFPAETLLGKTASANVGTGQPGRSVAHPPSTDNFARGVTINKEKERRWTFLKGEKSGPIIIDCGRSGMRIDGDDMALVAFPDGGPGWSLAQHAGQSIPHHRSLYFETRSAGSVTLKCL